MASLVSHGIVALSLGTCFYRPDIPRRVWVMGVACSILPDVDVIGFRYGIHYGDFWGHRGFTHSILFAALLASVVTLLGFQRKLPGISRWTIGTFLFLSTASHGLFDAMTDGGLGVAFFSPFDNHRYFLPWRPIRVSPIGLERFFTSRGLAVLESELVWIWLPAIVFAAAVLVLRRRRAFSRV